MYFSNLDIENVPTFIIQFSLSSMFFYCYAVSKAVQVCVLYYFAKFFLISFCIIFHVFFSLKTSHNTIGLKIVLQKAARNSEYLFKNVLQLKDTKSNPIELSVLSFDSFLYLIGYFSNISNLLFYVFHIFFYFLS